MLYALFLFLGLGFVIFAFIKVLADAGHNRKLIKGYLQIAEKYNAKFIAFLIYETGLDEIPQNNIACIFADDHTIGFQLMDSDYDKIILLHYDKINWISRLEPFETIAVESIELPPFATEYRVVISYKSEITQNDSYIVFRTGLYEYDYRNEYNKLVEELLRTDITKALASLANDCPKHLIRSNNVYTSETVEL